MTEQLTIQNFKALRNESLELRQLTVFTGENSSGKSTALLAYMMTFDPTSLSLSITKYLQERMKNFLSFDVSLADRFNISFKTEKDNVTVEGDNDKFQRTLSNTKKLIFLCADRIGPRSTYETDDSSVENSIGIRGEFAAYLLEKHKYKQIEKDLCKDTSSLTLETQVNYWLQHILQTSVKTEKIADRVLLTFAQGEEPYFSPLSTGVGTSLLLPILVSCLLSSKEDVILIENPEIHLHPKAQAFLGDFLAFIAHTGVQVIIETHCEHLIYKLCYNVNQKSIDSSELVFYYKKRNEPFQAILTDDKGRFIDKDGNRSGFPSGFFDATLNDYLSIRK